MVLKKRTKLLRDKFEQDVRKTNNGKLDIFAKLILMFSDFVNNVLPSLVSVIILIWFFNRIHDSIGFLKTVVLLGTLVLFSLRNINGKLGELCEKK